MNSSPVIVLGAGIVGICCALEIQRRGRKVLLLDPARPMSETSHGNAGIICNSGIHPLASPQLIREAPRLLSNRDPKLLLRYKEVPGMARWLWQFGRNCTTRKFRETTAVLMTLTRDALPRHLRLMEEAGCRHLLQETGWLKLYRSEASFRAGCEEIPWLDQAGVESEILNAVGLRALEPDLGPSYVGGVWLKNTHSVSDPAALGTAYLTLFLKAGGSIERRAATNLVKSGDTWQVVADDIVYTADHVVVAIGAWSNTLLGRIGVRLPYVMERGYHMMFDYPERARLGRSIVDQDFGFVITPMQQGLRATTASNLVARERPPDPRQLDRLLPEISRTFPVGSPQLDRPWMGRRVSTPDSLPLIGPLKDHPGIIIATGHGHLGLTFAPVTGQFVADEVFDSPHPLSAPLTPNRPQ